MSQNVFLNLLLSVIKENYINSGISAIIYYNFSWRTIILYYNNLIPPQLVLNTIPGVQIRPPNFAPDSLSGMRNKYIKNCTSRPILKIILEKSRISCPVYEKYLYWKCEHKYLHKLSDEYVKNIHRTYQDMYSRRRMTASHPLNRI